MSERITEKGRTPGKSKLMKRAVVIVLAVCVAAGGAAYGITTSRSGRAHAENTASDTETAVKKTYPSLLKSAGDTNTLSKDETVYVVSDADGSNQQITVNEFLKNGTASDEISDVSTLSGIKNTSGDETFTKNGNNITWKAEGNNIRYQGTTKNELPIEVKVSYYLDGKKVTPEQIAGKAGDVEIRFDYTVNQMDMTSYGTIQHPYTVASGVMLDNSHFTDITVTNGKAVDDGDSTVVLGLALPGLRESIGLSQEQLDIPESVTIKAKTDNFRLDGTYSVALSNFFSEINLSSADDLESQLDTLEDSLHQLSAASTELALGSQKLSDGASQLATGANSLDEGLVKLLAGSKSLRDGMTAYYAGVQSLNNGLQTLVSNNAALEAGGKNLEDGIFQLATKVLRSSLVQMGMSEADANTYTLTPENYKTVLGGLGNDSKVQQAAMKKAKAQIEAALKSNGVSDSQLSAVEAMAGALYAGNTQNALQQAGQYAKDAVTVQTANATISNDNTNFQTWYGQLQAAGMTAQFGGDQAAALVVKTALANNSGNIPETQQGQSAALSKAATMVQHANAFSEAQNNQEANIQKLLAGAVAENSSSTNDSITQLRQLLDGTVAYVNSVNNYAAGAKKAAEGSAQLASNGKQLVSGSQSLYAGMEQAANGSNQLNSGASELASGTKTLSDSMNKFDQEGIQKLVSTLSDNQAKSVLNRLKGVRAAGTEKVFVGGIADGMDGSSKIIFKTDEIKK